VWFNARHYWWSVCNILNVNPRTSVGYVGNVSRNRNDSEEGRYCEVVIPVSETESPTTNSHAPSFQSPASTKGLVLLSRTPHTGIYQPGTSHLPGVAAGITRWYHTWKVLWKRILKFCKGNSSKLSVDFCDISKVWQDALSKLLNKCILMSTRGGGGVRAAESAFGPRLIFFPCPPLRADRLKIFTLNRKTDSQLQSGLGLVWKG